MVRLIYGLKTLKRFFKNRLFSRHLIYEDGFFGSKNLVFLNTFLQVVEFYTTEAPFCCSSIGPQKSVLINSPIFSV